MQLSFFARKKIDFLVQTKEKVPLRREKYDSDLLYQDAYPYWKNKITYGLAST